MVNPNEEAFSWSDQPKNPSTLYSVTSVELWFWSFFHSTDTKFCLCSQHKLGVSFCLWLSILLERCSISLLTTSIECCRICCSRLTKPLQKREKQSSCLSLSHAVTTVTIKTKFFD
jgi:hypothetical protein